MESNQCSSKFKSSKKPNSLNTENNGVLNCSAEKKMKKDDSGIHVDKDENSSGDDSVATHSVPEVPTSNVTVQKSNLNSPDSGNPEVNGSGDETLQTKTDNEKKDESKATVKPDKKEDLNKFDPTPSTERPKHRWSAPLAAMRREYGSPVQYSPDLFRYSCYGSLHMAERLELMYKMKGHEGCVNTLNFNASGNKLVSGSDDLGVIIWNWPTSEVLLECNTGHRSNVFQAKFLPHCGDSQIVTCARDGQVRVAELSVSGTCNHTRKLAQHRGAAHKLAIFSDTPHTFLSCGEDCVVYEIDVRESKPEKLITCKNSDTQKKVALYSIHVNPSKPYEFVVGGRDPYIRVYDKRFSSDDGCVKKFSPEHLNLQRGAGDVKANVTSCTYNYNGSELLASYNDDDIFLFDANENDPTKYLHRYAGHRNSQTVKGVNFYGSKSEYVISGSDCGFIFFWDKETEHIVKYMHGDEAGVVNCLEPNPNMPVLATSGLDDDIKIWVPSCEEPPDLSGLKTHLINNMKDREDERNNEPDTLDDQVLWFIMQHLRRSRRRVLSQSGNDSSTSPSSEDSDEQDTEDFERYNQPAQCSQS